MRPHLVFRAWDRKGIIVVRACGITVSISNDHKTDVPDQHVPCLTCGAHGSQARRMMYHDCRLSARESAPSVDSTGQHDYTQRRTATVLLDVVRHRGLAGVRERQGSASRVESF